MPAALRQALFLRFYGHEFDAAERERILAHLADPHPADDAEERPRRTQVPVNWDDLEMALTWRSGESESFLDLRTGEVRQCRLSRFADERGDFELSEEEADAGLAAGCLVRVEPLEPSVEYGWMADFAVLLQRIDNVDPLTGATELVYTADENLVRPRELRDAIRALRIGSHDVPRGGGD